MSLTKAERKRADKKIEEALKILVAVGLPRQQCNERSALSLLALADVRPGTAWAAATRPLIGITPMMTFMAEHYGHPYAPNTRETVRRQTVHQFLDAALIVENPDDPSRATNSPKTVYQLSEEAQALLQAFGSGKWKNALEAFVGAMGSLSQKYAAEREMLRVPLVVAPGKQVELSPGGQNVLVERVLTDFGPLFTPGARQVYVGDTAEKYAYFDSELLQSLGVGIEPHGKMPDVILYFEEKGWLVLVEAVTSHGPIGAKRRRELETLFNGCTAGLVFVTAFLDHKALRKYMSDIAWETEVWVAETPTHLIHFNGEKFLGPNR